MIKRSKSEHIVVTELGSALKNGGFSTAAVRTAAPSDKAKFPYVYIQLIDAPEVSATADTVPSEHCIDLSFQIDVYSNASNGDITCSDITDLIVTRMKQLNFINSANQPMPKLNNNSIYRRTARFLGRWDGKTFYRR